MAWPPPSARLLRNIFRQDGWSALVMEARPAARSLPAGGAIGERREFGRRGFAAAKETAFCEISVRKLRYAHRMNNAETRGEVAEMEQIGFHFQREARRERRFSDEIWANRACFLGEAA